ncbi:MULTISPECIES: LysR family transcriptional regulator [unclassified Enterobacter]|uniref:LysR family transcriptional regulator n=1 Tax=unclassified Enterobacter TaxID=2608935 RepID=UPI000697DCA0|nr:LysR family transcriptional regulator [Enterobacter sp. NFIX58]SEP24947.1 DNA-binding transcriptional regulator, LysR family [Enterobacter sp. NFIX58]
MKGIDIKLIRAFITLADKGNYQHAAQALFITQPALSKQIKMLEEVMKGTLFIRGRKGATLTAFGHHLLSNANAILSAHDELLKQAKIFQKTCYKTLRVGLGISSFHHVPIWINHFRRTVTDCEVVIKEMASSLQCHMLTEGELDIGFIRMPVAGALTGRALFEEKLVLAVPGDKRIDTMNMTDVLSSLPLLQLSPDVMPCLAEQTALWQKNTKTTALPGPMADDIPTLLALVAGGNGTALVPGSVRHFLPPGVRLITLETDPVGWDIGIAWNPKIAHPQRDEFLRLVEETSTFDPRQGGLMHSLP